MKPSSLRTPRFEKAGMGGRASRLAPGWVQAPVGGQNFTRLPDKIQLITTPCQGFPVRVGVLSSFIRAAIRSKPRPSPRSDLRRSSAASSPS
jgi:hypothetical protein